MIQNEQSAHKRAPIKHFIKACWRWIKERKVLLRIHIIDYFYKRLFNHLLTCLKFCFNFKIIALCHCVRKQPTRAVRFWVYFYISSPGCLRRLTADWQHLNTPISPFSVTASLIQASLESILQKKKRKSVLKTWLLYAERNTDNYIIGKANIK